MTKRHPGGVWSDGTANRLSAALREEGARPLPKPVPGAADVRLGGPDVPDGEADDVAAAQAGVRQEDFAAVVHGVQQALVESVQGRFVSTTPAGLPRCSRGMRCRPMTR